MPLHPDKAGGLGFFTGLSYAFAPLLLAQGLFAGVIANQIFYANATLLQFRVELAPGVIAALLFIVGPLAVFAPALETARHVRMAGRNDAVTGAATIADDDLA